jgi:uncharacterized membrane protein YphA (DoxX/SURF4 family)
MQDQSKALNAVILLFRVIIGVVFIYASFDKIAHVSDFARAVHNYKMLTPLLDNIMAIALPWIELIAGLFLIVGYKVRGSSFVIAVLLLVFIAAVSFAIMRGLDISCGCFETKEGTKVGLELLIRDVVMLIMTGSILFFSNERKRETAGLV